MDRQVSLDVDTADELFLVEADALIAFVETEVEMNGPTTTHCTTCHETFHIDDPMGFSYTGCPVDSLGYGICPGCNTSQDGSGEWALMVGAIEEDEMNARCDDIDACKRADRIYWAN